jgi:peptidoglycan/xylan/chitin deacetylase (PgdA/CDA1 family)
VAVAGTFIYKNPPWWAGIEYFLRTFFGLLTALVLGRPLIISGANFAFHKRAFMQIGGYKHNSYSSDQIDIATRLSRIGKVVYDCKSFASTSERSVAKPVLSILIAFILNLSYFIEYVIKSLRPAVKKRSKKLASISTGTYLKIAVPVLLTGILCYGYFIPASPIFGKVYYRAVTSTKVIALTFDDGPNEPYTSQILDILEKYNVHATFFLIGYNVNLYPDTAKRIFADGNIIGNHSYYHRANHALSFNAFKEIQLAQETIYQIAGVKPHLYRPPHGKKTPWELEAIKHEGFVEVMWNISTNELSGRSPQFMADQIIKKSSPGGIILLHDGYGIIHGSERSDKSDTVAMLPIIIEHLQSEGYTFVTIPELFNVPAYDRVAE